MADGQLNPSRRAVLGAAAGLPLLAEPRLGETLGPLHHASHGPPPRPGEELWADAFSAFRHAEAGVRAIEAATAGGSVADEEAWQPRHDAACAAMEAALARAILVPAPDLSALAEKLTLLFAHAMEPGAVDEGWIAVVTADVWRLLRRP